MQIVKIARQLRIACGVQAFFTLVLLNLRHGEFGLDGLGAAAEIGCRLHGFFNAGL